METKHIGSRITLLIILLFVLSGIFIIIKKNLSDKKIQPVPTNKQGESKDNTKPGMIIQKVTEIIKNNSDLNQLKIAEQPFYLWWLSDDDWNIIIKKGSGISYDYKSEQSTDSKLAETKTSKIFHSTVRNVMLENDFVQNIKNSSSSEKDDTYYDYVQAYSNDTLLCVALSNGDGYKFSVNCAVIDEYESAYKEQVPFLKGLNMTGKESGTVSDIKIKNNIVATMQVHWRRSGAVAFMYKKDTEWKKIIIAQAVPECEALKKENVPEEFWIDCYDSSQVLKPEGSAWK